MNGCEKLIRKIKFLKAMEQSNPQSATVGLDLDSIRVTKLEAHLVRCSEYIQLEAHSAKSCSTVKKWERQ